MAIYHLVSCCISNCRNVEEWIQSGKESLTDISLSLEALLLLL